MLIIENKFKTFLKLLWNKIKIIFTIIGIILLIVISGLILVDFTPSNNADKIEEIEKRITILESFHDIEREKQ